MGKDLYTPIDLILINRKLKNNPVLAFLTTYRKGIKLISFRIELFCFGAETKSVMPGPCNVPVHNLKISVFSLWAKRSNT